MIAKRMFYHWLENRLFIGFAHAIGRISLKRLYTLKVNLHNILRLPDWLTQLYGPPFFNIER